MNGHCGGPDPSNRCSAPSRSSPSAALVAPADAGSARTTTRAPVGSAANRDRMRCRSRRCTRWRTTDPPTPRPTTKPTFAPSAAPERVRCTTRQPRPTRRPRCTAVAKSSRRVRRAIAGSNVTVFRTAALQADSSVRPLRRRAAMMARPARVRIRNRNPWVLARRRLFGWNVRLPLLTGRSPGARFSLRPLPVQAAPLQLRSHPVSGPCLPWARARKNARRSAGDEQSLSGQ